MRIIYVTFNVSRYYKNILTTIYYCVLLFTYNYVCIFFHDINFPRIIARVRNKWIAPFVGFKKKIVVDGKGGDKNWKRQEKDPRAQRERKD